MKKLLVLLVIIAIGCGKEAQSADQPTLERVKPVTPDAGIDAHGCKTSAGFTWSEIKADCVRVFEVGVMLKASDNPDGLKMPAFVIVEKQRAEVFIQTEKPIMLTASANGIFESGDWRLIYTAGFEENGKTVKQPVYLLSKKGKILFAGFAEPAK